MAQAYVPAGHRYAEPERFAMAVASKPHSAEVDAFLDAFDCLAQAVRRARGARSQGSDRQLTLSQYGLLLPLAEKEEARVRDLAEAAGITPPTATRILDALERGGIVRRAPDSADRRAISVTLTEHGRGVLQARHAWIRERQREFYARLDAAEHAIAPGLLRGVAELIDELAAGP
jgi:DNA-binding MarR family transcriptional regulator